MLMRLLRWLCIGMVLVFMLISPTSAQVTEQWVACYNGPANDWDEARTLVVDSAGNVYVTGSSYGSSSDADYATIKYDGDGNELWVARYNGPANGNDRAWALAVDYAGNVYVTGHSYGSGSSHDYATIKYDGDGNELWVVRYNGPANLGDSAQALAIGSDGNVYVTGSSGGSGSHLDYTTVKYDTDGNELWVTRYNGPANGTDYPTALAIDSAGNVYVTGYIVGSGSMEDYATVKYDTDGYELWVARYNGPANDWDGALALAVDSAGNVYVTGRSVGSGSNKDYATVKYDTDGYELWVARYNGPANDWDSAQALAVDSAGNVYVTGSSFSGDNENYYATVKYDTDGYELWVTRYNGPENSGNYARDLAVDSTGNVYVTGTSFGGDIENDYATVKYSQAIEIGIDIKPGNYLNNINLKSRGKVPVAILTTDEFDANDVDPVSCEFAGASPLRWNMEDVDDDGDLDMVMHCLTQELDLNPNSTEASIRGETHDGLMITGTDSVRIVPKAR